MWGEESMTLKQTVTIKIRPASKIKKGYEARTNLVKGEKGNLFGDLLSILNKWRNCFSHVLNKGG
jgi:hypothetical protein